MCLNYEDTPQDLGGGSERGSAESSEGRVCVLTGAGDLSRRSARGRGAVRPRALPDSARHLELLKQRRLCDLGCFGPLGWNTGEHRADHLSLKPTEIDTFQ